MIMRIGMQIYAYKKNSILVGIGLFWCTQFVPDVDYRQACVGTQIQTSAREATRMR